MGVPGASGAIGASVTERFQPASFTWVAETKIRPQWQDAKIVSHEIIATDTASLVFQLDAPMHYEPGQYANIRLSFSDRDRPVQRSYSIASPPDPNRSTIELIVTKVPDGLVSTRLVDEVKVGDTIPVRGPYGKFYWNETKRSPILMVAAGSGVVPFLAMTEYLCNRQIDVAATLLVSSRTYEHLIGKDVYERLIKVDIAPQVLTTFTRDDEDPRANFHRRIDRDMLEAAGARTAHAVFLCGPDEMVRNARDDLLALGVDPDEIQTEIYP